MRPAGTSRPPDLIRGEIAEAESSLEGRRSGIALWLAGFRACMPGFISWPGLKGKFFTPGIRYSSRMDRPGGNGQLLDLTGKICGSEAYLRVLKAEMMREGEAPCAPEELRLFPGL
jgi:hypothetical protein